MLVDDLHRMHAFLYIPTKRIFYHFGCQNAYFAVKKRWKFTDYQKKWSG